METQTHQNTFDLQPVVIHESRISTVKHEIFAADKNFHFLFYQFELFAEGNLCGFLTHGKVGLVEGDKFAG